MILENILFISSKENLRTNLSFWRLTEEKNQVRILYFMCELWDNQVVLSWGRWFCTQGWFSNAGDIFTSYDWGKGTTDT